MLVSVTTLNDQIFTLEVSDELELENFKAMCEYEVGILAREIVVMWNGRPLHDGKRTMKEYGIKNGDMLLLQQIRGQQGQQQPFTDSSPSGVPNIDFGQIQIPGLMGATSSGYQQQPQQGSFPEDDPAAVRKLLLANPHELSLLKERNPPLAEALLSDDPEKFNKIYLAQRKERKEKEREKIKLMNADPFDPKAQEVIAEEIRMKNVESNMENAIEFAPESFGQVLMLYIDCRVNGHAVKAFVDSGAQMTIMSQTCAERCNIMRLVDPRWAGIAKGVGTQKIIGRVHLGQIQIEKDFLQSSFSILENQPMDMLLGLDMLKRHQCCIDLKRNKLVIGTTGTETSFLTESQLPEQSRLNYNHPPSPKSTSQEDQQLAEALARSQDETGASSSRSAGSSNSRSFPEQVVQDLMSNGFPRDRVIEELSIANGSKEAALLALFAKAFTVP
ncbi:protein DDI1 homolog 2-like [Mizuhopecten yessoensis]|uniref:Protein DDI1-like 2 n=1 Tax=Mizuhopecten yessoensis TaxID=6573 RepID=A0A210R0A4_MIZYE|nr:protein DDI1 homolog 2-like [Mizuhopecten yessoensis]OWF54456.1 Protein DDI1-like 2 [Mizuhopecten yessoensis]